MLRKDGGLNEKFGQCITLLNTTSKPQNFMKNQNVSFPYSGSLKHEQHEGKDPKPKITRYRQAAKTPVQE